MIKNLYSKTGEQYKDNFVGNVFCMIDQIMGMEG